MSLIRFSARPFVFYCLVGQIFLVSISEISIKYKNSSFKSSENIQKKERGPDRSVSDNQSSSVTLIKLASLYEAYLPVQAGLSPTLSKTL